MSEKIDFRFNQPVTLTLAFAEGRAVPSKFLGSVRTMRTTKDARVFFCDPALEAKIAALNPAPGVQVEITKLEREGARKGYDWRVSRIGEQGDGTYKIPKADPSRPPASESALVTTLGPSSAAIVNPQVTPQAEPVSIVEAHARRLIDLQAGLMQYAQKYGGAVSRDDVRTILISAYIQLRGVTLAKPRRVQR